MLFVVCLIFNERGIPPTMEGRFINDFFIYFLIKKKKIKKNDSKNRSTAPNCNFDVKPDP